MPTVNSANGSLALARAPTHPAPLQAPRNGRLTVSIGQYSDKGRKPTNQDFHGAFIPDEPLLHSKGISVALADGISSSDVSREASESAVAGFFADYYCTSEAWSVKTSAQRVLCALNSWLHSQTQSSRFRYDKDRGYVCTFSALIIKSNTAHLFHAGDTRIYRLCDDGLEQLTTDHRLWISREKSYLSRALGMNAQLDIDYRVEFIEQGGIFVLATDGVYEHIDESAIVETINRFSHNLDLAAKAVASLAYRNGSTDNLTIQVVRIEELPQEDATEIRLKLGELPLPPMLEPRTIFDGYRIIRRLHASSRSHVYLAVDEENIQVVIKTPSIDLQKDRAYLERFLMEEWIARRINSAHVLKPCRQTRKRNYLYLVTEYVEGQTLTQWMIDHPRPEVETVREIVEQIAKGLRAFHRLEMLHQDLRPENIMIDSTGTVKIIDFGSTQVAGIIEVENQTAPQTILGTAQYTAPEYFLGESGTTRSDLFSLGVIAYQMLSGRLPYGTQVAKSRTRQAQRKLAYRSVLAEDREIPVWIDETLRQAVHPNPDKRYGELSEFTYDLRFPNKLFLSKTRPPLIERNPLAIWKGVSCLLAVIVLVLLAQ